MTFEQLWESAEEIVEESVNDYLKKIGCSINDPILKDCEIRNKLLLEINTKLSQAIVQNNGSDKDEIAGNLAIGNILFLISYFSKKYNINIYKALKQTIDDHKISICEDC